MEARRKPLVWLSDEITTPPFSPEARLEAALLLTRLQEGDLVGMPASRPMPEIGRGCHELRIRDRNVSWRIFYHLDRDAVILLHLAKKQSRKTTDRDLETCRKRLARYRAER